MFNMSSRPGRAIGCFLPSCRSLRLFASCGLALYVVAITPLHGEDQPTGREIYQRHCVLCHGMDGEGSEQDYPYPLAGDRSMAQLARFISKSMPPDRPGTCDEEDAKRVATYIFGEFYSREARAGRRSPRIETARLTGRQYTNTMADLMVAFYGSKASKPARDFAGTTRRSMPTVMANRRFRE